MKLARSGFAILAILLASQAGVTNARAWAAAARVAPKASGLIDINHATLDQLKTLPGIQDAGAAKIVKNRPYANKTQLSTKGVLSAATYAKIRAHIIARQ
jgi:DNA uptake protein ComE-like DNA-binding protein